MWSPAVLIIPISVAVMFCLIDTKRGSHICTYCGYKGYQAISINGSFIVELCLCLCFIVPWLIYSFWRRAPREVVCPNCNRDTMVVLSTPLGQKVHQEFYVYTKPEPKIDSTKMLTARRRIII